MQAQGLTQETLEALKSVIANGGIAYKDITTGLNYVWYDLQPIVDRTFPVITPLRNTTPRLAGDGGTSTHWKEVYGINSTNLSIGVSEGNRNATVTTLERDHVSQYAEIGLEDFVTWKADQAAGRLTPEVKAMAVENLLYASLIGEELVLLGGNTGNVAGQNTGLPLGTAPTPVATLVAGGAMTAQATGVYVVALTLEGFLNSSVSGGVPASITRNNIDGSSDTYGGGSSQASAQSNSVTTTGGNLSVSAHCAAVKGAFAYAWYVGLFSAGAAGASLAAITTINSVLITANPTGTDTASAHASDNSGNKLIFDGYLTQALAGGGLWATQATGTDGTGTPLTSDGAGGILEFETDFLYFWTNFRLQPTRILVNAQEKNNIKKKLVTNSGTPLYRINATSDGKGTISGGIDAISYLPQYSMGAPSPVPIDIHPDMPPGTIFYMCERLPYRIQNMRYTANIRTLQEWRQIDWPIVKRRWEYGVYANELFEMHFSPAFGVRTNIANG